MSESYHFPRDTRRVINHELMNFKGYCRNCWKRFDKVYEIHHKDIEGKTLEEIRNLIADRNRCCPRPDIRFIPV